MDTIILTKRQAVELYGSEDCKKHFAKYGKFTNRDIEKSLIKEMRRYYHSVKIVKPEKGRGYVYEFIGKKNVVTPKEDGRINNGAWSIPYTKNMDIMVVSVLEQGFVNDTAQSLSKWAVVFGSITPAEYELLQSRYNEYIRSQHLQDLKDNKIILEGEDRILDDFTYTVKENINQLAGTLNRMKKLEIIEYYPVYKGHLKDTNETINLQEDTVKQILTLRRNLMEQYDVGDWYLNTFKNSPKTRAYNEAWSAGLAQVTDEKGDVLGLDYYYVVYAIILKARKKKIIRYLEKYSKEAIERFKQNNELFLTDNKAFYHKERHDYVVKEAQGKESKFLSEKTKTCTLDENLQEVYGTETLTKTYYNLRENFTFDEGYYSLYFDRLYAERIKKLQEHYGYTFK
ncbi:hypothetical protein [Neobacillus drentensis]|uniref:hypothetical protein n=1 Tax=Neobacillus drentensis TaxID=220684 RepID=UPI002FFF6F9C